jgi:hypothetical protein
MSNIYFFSFLVVCIGMIFPVLRWRATAMRKLADRVGFQFTKDGSLPSSFTLECKPFVYKPLVWNILEGHQNGTPILIFDSVVGKTYRTVIAIRTTASPYSIGAETISGRIDESNGWIAITKRGFPLMVWGMSTRKIEENLRSLLI